MTKPPPIRYSDAPDWVKNSPWLGDGAKTYRQRELDDGHEKIERLKASPDSDHRRAVELLKTDDRSIDDYITRVRTLPEAQKKRGVKKGGGTIAADRERWLLKLADTLGRRPTKKDIEDHAISSPAENPETSYETRLRELLKARARVSRKGVG